MPRIPGVNHQDAVRALQKAGFRVVLQGKHIVMTDDVRIITIPRHNRVNAFTMGGIVRDAGLTEDEFRAQPHGRCYAGVVVFAPRPTCRKARAGLFFPATSTLSPLGPAVKRTAVLVDGQSSSTPPERRWCLQLDALTGSGGTA